VRWQLAEIYVLISSCEHSNSPEHRSISKILTRRACYSILQNDCSGDFADDLSKWSACTSATCSYLQHTETHRSTRCTHFIDIHVDHLQIPFTHCNTLQQTATHCNTLQNKMYLVHQHPRRPNAAALSRPADRLRARAVPNHRLCVYLHICIFTYICI